MTDIKKPCVRVFTLVYGKPYVDKLCNFSLPSLFQAQNIPALLDRFDVTIQLYTMSESRVYLDRSIRRAVAQIYPDQPTMRDRVLGLFKIKARDLAGKTADLARADPTAHGNALSRKWQGFCLLEEIKACLADDAIMIQSGAELVFGNGSLFNLMHTAHEHSASIAALYLGWKRRHSLPPLRRNPGQSRTLGSRHWRWNPCIARRPNWSGAAAGISRSFTGKRSFL